MRGSWSSPINSLMSAIAITINSSNTHYRSDSPTLSDDDSNIPYTVQPSSSQHPPPQQQHHTENEQQQQQHQQKRGYKKKFAHEWSHNDTLTLIDLWRGEESTYNKRCQAYRDKGERTNAYERIRLSLDEGGTTVSAEEIYSKMHSLRVYYSATNNKAEAARRKYGSEEEANITWPYYEKLSFLKKNMNPRPTASNPRPAAGAAPQNTSYNTMVSPTMVVQSSPSHGGVDIELDDPTQLDPPVTRAKRSRTSWLSNTSGETQTHYTPADTTNGPDYHHHYQQQQQQQRELSEDEGTADDLFCRMLAIQLKELPKQAREFAKHEISGVMLRARFPEQQRDGR